MGKTSYQVLVLTFKYNSGIAIMVNCMNQDARIVKFKFVKLAKMELIL